MGIIINNGIKKIILNSQNMKTPHTNPSCFKDTAKQAGETIQSDVRSNFQLPHSSIWTLAFLAIAGVTAFLHNARAGTLGSADTFAVLANQTVTSTGATVLNGNLGLTPGTSITGSPTVNGSTYTGTDTVAEQAIADANSAYTTLGAESVTTDLTGQDLGGLTLTNGIYFFSSSAALTGTLVHSASRSPQHG
jgi:hypothetical protein